MKKMLTVSAAIFVCSLCMAQALLNPNQLLLDSDAAFLPLKSKFTLMLENFESSGRKQWFQMDCFVDGNARYLLVFTDPGIMRGQTQLRLGDTIYSYVRKVDKTSQVSARVSFYQSVLSQEDIMSSMLSTFYTVEKVESKTGPQGQAIFSMTLIAQNKRAAYAKIVADVDAQTLLPVSRFFYTQSGQLVKEMRVEEIKRSAGVLVSLRFRMIDALKAGSYTLVTMSSFDTNLQMPASWFTQQYMKAAAK